MSKDRTSPAPTTGYIPAGRWIDRQHVPDILHLHLGGRSVNGTY